MLRLNKKGITHVDWAISMGIFIIYVSFLIIFIMPSLLKTQFDPSTLFDSFEKNFLKPLEWTVVKIPLNIEKLMDKPAPDSISARLTFSLGSDENRFTTLSPSAEDDLTTYNDVDGQPTIGSPPILEFTDANKKKIIFGCNLITPGCNFVMDFTVASLKSENKPEFDLKCEPDEDKNYCKASLGIEEEIKGIKEKPFTITPTQESPSFKRYKDGTFSGYSILKTQDLKFSDNVNFDIWYPEGVNKRSIFDQDVFDNPEEKPPKAPENANVFIKEFKRFYVDEFGDLKPVVFYFETW